jgi:hypothetical protein
MTSFYLYTSFFGRGGMGVGAGRGWNAVVGQTDDHFLTALYVDRERNNNFYFFIKTLRPNICLYFRLSVFLSDFRLETNYHQLLLSEIIWTKGITLSKRR